MANLAKTATLTGTGVDTVTLAPNSRDVLVVVNQHASVYMYFTYATGGATPATPTSGGDECFPVMPSSSTSIPLPGTPGTLTVKIIGNSNTYTVCCLSAL